MNTTRQRPFPLNTRAHVISTTYAHDGLHAGAIVRVVNERRHDPMRRDVTWYDERAQRWREYVVKVSHMSAIDD